MGTAKTHWLLTEARDFTTASAAVLTFFKKSLLLSYDTVCVIESDSFAASDARFWPALEGGVAENALVLRGFLDDLRAEGCRVIEDLAVLPVGYPSKVLHLIAHLVDGFIGIDSVFYNRIEDSHGLSAALREKIHSQPSHYWLIRVEAGFGTEEEASLIHRDKHTL